MTFNGYCMVWTSPFTTCSAMMGESRVAPTPTYPYPNLNPIPSLYLLHPTNSSTERYVSQEKVERCTSTKHPVLPGKKDVVGHRNIPLYFESETIATDSTGSIRYFPNGHLKQHYPDEEIARERRERRKQLKRKTASVQAQLNLLAAPLNVAATEERPPVAAVEQWTHRAAGGEGENEGDRETILK